VTTLITLEEPMQTIHNEVTVARSPDDVWALLRDLTAVTDWVPGIAGARLDGTRRICTTVEGEEIHEEIELDDARRTYAYTQPVHPLGFKESRGSLAVTGNGADSHVAWHADTRGVRPQDMSFWGRSSSQAGSRNGSRGPRAMPAHLPAHCAESWGGV
jgi:hypothetical protein